MRYRVSSLIRAEVGAQLDLKVDEPQRSLGRDVTVDFIRGQLVLTRTDQHILVNGTLRTAVSAECVRCLDSFRLLLNVQLEELYALNPGPVVAVPQYVVAVDGTIDLTSPLREQIVLAQPVNPICRPDCRGLCAHCGKNLNEGPCECEEETVDPRLAALKALLK